ncbi:MAG: hypothetical protein LQ343_003295 [Gyalolechia ehrenbergii]|nr:MAG: hypothetical protein LQ343_003295 [Gyalolechia ehrenbergii]
MTSSASLGTLFTVESGPPPAAVRKDAQNRHPPPSALELDEITLGNGYTGPSPPPTPGGAQTPITPNELEMSRPPTPRTGDAVEALQTLYNPPMNKWRFAVGFISAAPTTPPLLARLGRARTLILAQMSMMVGYIMLVCTPPFPVVVLSFLFIGFGEAVNLALNNTFCANLANYATTLGLFHGSYGIGGTVGPLMATALVSTGRKWSSFYYISIGVTFLNICMAYWAFRNYETDNPAQHNALLRTASGQKTSKSELLQQALKNKTTILGSLFIFAYQGAEVSISGWVISFLITYRHGEPSRVGYVTAGFWAGITIGRFVLTHPAHRIGEKTAVIGLVVGATLFQFLVWFVPNVIGESVAVAIVGLLLGPVYPCSTAVYSKLLDKSIQMSSLAIVSALGSSGGAVAPFFTGLLAQEVGTWVLHPICVGLFVGMVALWGCLPRLGKKEE